MPNNKPKGSPSWAPKCAAMAAHCQPTQLAHIAMHMAMPAHCLPTSSAMPALFLNNMRSNACLLPAKMLGNVLSIFNQHAQQQCMPTANQPARQCLLRKARQCLLGNYVPWLTIAEKMGAIAEKMCSNAEKFEPWLTIANSHVRQCLAIADPRV
ncbi:hypothetical protein Acr_00g0041450 [Actinidia rufa]|uniref:Uncharacterized protein n=1 Tax=Actinidia rufa TaxID=165716 RepID=A0A7J0DJU3_9ERIC|nr:hypothetical protein Acr_00g0041450 [Actinidia rufa]